MDVSEEFLQATLDALSANIAVLDTNLDYAPEFFRLLSWSGIRKDSGVRAGTVRRRPEFLRIPLRD